MGGGGGAGMGIIHGYITLVHDFPRFLGNCTHAQTVLVDTRATLSWGGGVAWEPVFPVAK